MARWINAALHDSEPEPEYVSTGESFVDSPVNRFRGSLSQCSFIDKVWWALNVVHGQHCLQLCYTFWLQPKEIS